VRERESEIESEIESKSRAIEIEIERSYAESNGKANKLNVFQIDSRERNRE
jgi:hypothetical protein